MTRSGWWLIAALSLVPIAWPIDAQPEAIAGVVLEIVPPVFLRPSPAGSEVMLDPERDLGRVLLDGQALRSGPGGRVRFHAAGQTETLGAARGRFEVRATPAGPTRAEQDAARKALNAYGRAGGSRALTSILYSPGDQSVVRLDALEVRWTLRESRGSMVVELRTAPGRVVWTSGTVNAAAGRLPAAATAALRDALRQAEGRNAGADAWSIVLRDDSGVVAFTTFRTLSPSAASELATRLREADAEPEPLLRTIARAFALANLALYNDAADEFDRMLLKTPRSEALIRAAIDAHARTGNGERVRELSVGLGRGR
jgi:hypothetical protein